METSGRFRDCMVLTNGIRLHVVQGGDARQPPLLLLHGIAERAESWEPVTNELAQQFWLIMPDLRGHHQSDWPETGYALGDYAADVLGVLDAFRINTAFVLGHALGAVIAMVLAVQSPERVRAVVLEDPPSEQNDHAQHTWLGALLSAKHGTPRQTYVALQGMHPEYGEAEWRRRAEWLRATADGPFLAWRQRPNAEGCFNAILPRIPHPVLLLQADPRNGGVLAPAAVQQACESHARCRVVRFPDTGPAIHRERPAEFVAAAIRFFGAESSVVL